MKVLFLGLFYDEEGLQQSYKESKSGVQIAAHRFQTLLIKGMQEKGVDVQCIHSLPSGTYPFHDGRARIADKAWGEANHRIGYVNLPFFKQRAQYKKALRLLRERLSGENPPDVILVYYVHLPFWKALQKIKKQFPKVKIVCIMTEAVPGRGDICDNSQNKKKGNKMVAACKIADGFCLISPHLTEPLEVGERPYMVLDGIAEEQTALYVHAKRKENTFLYTGGVYAQFNVDVLIDAFAYLPEATLWLCGREEGMQERLEKSNNVQHFGEVPFEQLQRYRQQCSYLINPRQPTGTYTKYSFPSKTMEYLACGKPTVGYMLEGMGKEYIPYINPLTGKDAIALAEQLKALMKKEYQQLLQVAEKGKEFVLTQKTRGAQAERLIKFLEQL